MYDAVRSEIIEANEQQRAYERLGREKDFIRVQKIREFLERRGLKHTIRDER